jgi:hypothetical protein
MSEEKRLNVLVKTLVETLRDLIYGGELTLADEKRVRATLDQFDDDLMTDPRDDRIAELEAALIESNDLASHAYRAARSAARDIALEWGASGEDLAAKAMEVEAHYWKATAKDVAPIFNTEEE